MYPQTLMNSSQPQPMASGINPYVARFGGMTPHLGGMMVQGMGDPSMPPHNIGQSGQMMGMNPNVTPYTMHGSWPPTATQNSDPRLKKN
jgi:hypothetical protein